MKQHTISATSEDLEVDIYEARDSKAVHLSLIGFTSYKTKPHYLELFPALVEQGVTSVTFDYSGHGDSKIDINEITPAQHFIEVIGVYDWMTKTYPDLPIYVTGSSYGGFQAIQLTKYRQFDKLVLRAPAIYRPQDFYTPAGDRSQSFIDELRRDIDALSTHPLLARAKRFAGETTVLVHELDEAVPKETTQAIAGAFRVSPTIALGFKHSLDGESAEKLTFYNNLVMDALLG